MNDMVLDYSKKPLIKKLGTREGFKIFIANPPENHYPILGSLPKGVSVAEKLTDHLDLIHFFTKKRKELESNFPTLKQALSQKGILWISWPKRSSGMDTDLNEDSVREVGLKNGLVDVKVIALDEIWSALKFVYRLKDRK